MFKKIEYVYAVYKEQSFTKAAEKLYISQPCLSAAIKKTEDEIGMPLFERRYSKVRPTKIGLEYIETAKIIMDLEKSFMSRVNDINNLEYGSITVGGSNYVSSYIIPRIVSRFSVMYPKIDINLVEMSSVELEKKLENEEVDLVIDSFDENENLYEYYPLFDERIMLAVPAVSKSNKGLEKYRILPENIYNSDLEQAQRIPIDYFKDEKFILLKKGNNMYKHAMEVMKKSGFTPEVAYRLDQLITSYALAASNNGVCFVTDTIFRYHRFGDDVYLYNIEGCTGRTMHIAKKRNRYATNAMQKFIEIARENIK